MDLMADVFAATIAFKRDLLMGLASGVVFVLGMLLARSLWRWELRRTEARRLLYSDMQRVSTYVWMGLGFALCGAGILVVMRLLGASVGLLVCLLFLFGSMAAMRMWVATAKRLANRIIALQEAAPSP